MLNNKPYQAHILLQPYIKDVVVLESKPIKSQPQPLACFADGLPGIMFWQSEGEIFLNENKKKLSCLFLYGQTVKPIQINAIAGCRIVIVYLYPHVVKALFGIEAQELTDTCTDMELLPVKGVKTLKAQLAQSISGKEQQDILLGFLYELILGRQITVERDLHYVTHQLMRTKGNTPLRIFIHEFNISQRTFERKFLRHVGIPARLYARICRFTAALSQIRSSAQLRLTDVAYENGFADQAHLSRTFKEFTGITPTEYLLQYNITAGNVGYNSFLPS